MSHEKYGESDEWYTPAYVFDALGVTFDLDVASPPEGPRHVPHSRFYSDRSLDREWSGFVWMNPPYGHQKTKQAWLNKFFDHGNGIALLPDRTSTDWWQSASNRSDVYLFTREKIKFERRDGSTGNQPGNGNTFFAIGKKASNALIQAKTLGVVQVPFRRTARSTCRKTGEPQ
jgi:hypothetical protein